MFGGVGWLKNLAYSAVMLGLCWVRNWRVALFGHNIVRSVFVWVAVHRDSIGFSSRLWAAQKDCQSGVGVGGGGNGGGGGGVADVDATDTVGAACGVGEM